MTAHKFLRRWVVRRLGTKLIGNLASASNCRYLRAIPTVHSQAAKDVTQGTQKYVTTKFMLPDHIRRSPNGYHNVY